MSCALLALINCFLRNTDYILLLGGVVGVSVVPILLMVLHCRTLRAHGQLSRWNSKTNASTTYSVSR